MISPVGRTRGFTLIEIAIVLVVIGLLLSGGLLSLAPVIQSSRVNETESKLDLLEEALILHAIVNGCLPCPATGATASTAATVGQAVDDAAYNTGCADNNCAATQGVVPWQNLGISEEDATDGFGYRIGYATVSALTVTSGMDRTGGYPAGNLTVTNITPVNLTTAAAYVLISHGDDHRGGFQKITGAAGPTTTGTANQVENDDGDTTFIQNERDFSLTFGNANYFDDIVRWRTAPIIVQLCGPGSCGNSV